MKLLGIKSKILIMLLGVSLGSIVIIAYLAFRSGNQALTEGVFDHLTSVRAAKACQIESYLEGIESQVRVLGQDHMVASAALRFREAFAALADQEIPGEWDEALDAYYRDEFLPRLQENVEGSPVFEAYRPTHPATRFLQHHYIAGNPNPVGEKAQLADAGDGSAYSRVHAEYHEIFRSLVDEFGYYDMFLVDPDSGVIVYSVFKETDFATSLRDGPYSNTNLAALVQKVRETPDPGFVRVIDFARYRPSYSGPAAFIATPVYQGPRLVGILAFQLPVDKINRIMTGNRGWQEDGLGATGETYLVGSDHRMRSISRFLIEDPDGYAQALRASGVPDSTVLRILRRKTSILEQEVRNEAANEAIQGASGTRIVDDYRGVPVLSSYAPLALPDVSWVILSEIDQAEAYAAITGFERRLVVSAVILMFVVTLLAMLLASSFVRPIRALSEGARRVSEGETGFRIASSSRDEFGELADSFNQMVAGVDAQNARIEETNRENEALLAQILPKRVVKRLRAGEEPIADAHDSVTVLFSDLVGFTKLARSVLPKQSVAMLNDLVSSFDEAAAQHGVEKIKTIGDGYMAAAGLAGSRLDHAKRTLDLSCDMLGIVRRFNNEHGLALELRIGVNSGPVVAGIIGRDKILYDLWGDTVNRANRMKTDAAPGEVLVTLAVAEAVKGLYEFEPRGPDAFVLRSGLDLAGSGASALARSSARRGSCGPSPWFSVFRCWPSRSAKWPTGSCGRAGPWRRWRGGFATSCCRSP